jgi:hypothetical protein
VAIVAIADRRQFAASFDECSIEGLRRGRLDRRDRRAPHDGKGGCRTAKQHDGNDAGDNSGRSRHPLPLRLLLLPRVLTQIARRRSFTKQQLPQICLAVARTTAPVAVSNRD